MTRLFATNRKAMTMGALNRRFERDTAFSWTPRTTGPAATHAGLNEGLALRFGTYAPIARPRWFSLGRLTVLVGAQAGRWASLSDTDASWLYGARWALGWR